MQWMLVTQVQNSYYGDDMKADIEYGGMMMKQHADLLPHAGNILRMTLFFDEWNNNFTLSQDFSLDTEA